MGIVYKQNISMTTIVTHNYQGFAIAQKERDSYVSLTDMAKAAGKLVGHYLALDSTKAKVNYLASRLNVPCDEVLIVVKGGNKNTNQGAWAHAEIAEDFKRWCNLSKIKTSTKISESSIKNLLADRLRGKKEVACKSGFVDVLTDLEVIEVKAIKDWKDAIGQSMVYACEFKGLSPRIHLFGYASQEYKQMIISFCAQLNVAVSFEVDHD